MLGRGWRKIPSRDAHEILSWLLFGNKMTKMHEMMDWPAQILGPNHRVVGHDAGGISVLAFLNALTTAANPATNGGNFGTAFAQEFLKNFGAGILHVAQDEVFSALKRAAGNATQYDRPIDQILKDLQKQKQPFNPYLPPKPAKRKK
jgi:hypothetical protein